MVSTSASNARAPTRAELGRIAGGLITDEGLVEKDWHVVRALAHLSRLTWGGTTRLVFCGGTSLSKGWGLISRFSEDIDFRLWHDAEDVPRSLCREVRTLVLETLGQEGFAEKEDKRKVRDGSRFVEMHFDYRGRTPVPQGIRQEIKIELTMDRPRLAPVAKPVTSFVAQARRHAAEVTSILCLDPVEIAAEKLSAFSWRALNRRRGEKGDDASVVRHLYDLATLHGQVVPAWPFRSLAREVARSDAERGAAERPNEPGPLIARLAKMLEDDPVWRQEYDAYIHEVGYGPVEKRVSFDEALEKWKLYGETFPESE